jgi:predicted alpha/beta superfamily hydrolase
MEPSDQQSPQLDRQIVLNHSVNPSVTGDLRLHEFPSRIFRNTRWLRVWLPPNYDAPENSARHYPVFYLNDGQNLFDRTVAFGGNEWGVDETADILIREQKIPPMIIVGIDNTGVDRIKEYLPYRSFSPRVLRPQGKNYPDFLIHEVMAFVHARYRLASGPENTGLGGSSLGGLISLYTAMERPGIFGRLLIESPSLFISGRKILKEIRHVRHWPERVYLGIGTRESGREDKDRQFVQDLQALERVMRHTGLDDAHLKVWLEEGANHSESSWGNRFPEALTFLFAPTS